MKLQIRSLETIVMSRRTERVGNLIRNILGPILLTKMSDPRFDPIATSITRVEVPEDLMTAKVYISVAGDQKNQTKTIAALRHAAGYLQEQMAKQIRLRRTPRLDFQIDEKLKKITETLNLIAEVTKELREKQQDPESLQSSETANQ